MPKNENTKNYIDAELATIHKANEARLADLSREIADLKCGTVELLAELDAWLAPGAIEHGHGTALHPVKANVACRPSWAETVVRAKAELAARALREPTGSIELLSAEENVEITQHLSRPLYERIPWDRWDYLVAFGVGLAGAVVDVLLGTPGRFVQQAMADKNHWLGKWMESIHARAPGGAPIDYQGPDFGGPYHRGLTTGHDILRPLEGIRQFKDGVFRGFYYTDGVKHVVETAVNQYGNAYSSMSWGAAVLAWMVHNACDYFSSNSLPIPGTSWLYEMSDRDVRVFVQKELYQRRINLRHVNLQTLAPLIVEVGISAYSALRQRNTDAPKEALEQKRSELLVLGHTLTTAVNIGKILLLNDPTMLNVPALLALLRRILGLVIMEQKRNSFVARIARNSRELLRSQEDIEHMLEAQITSPILLS